MSPEEMSRFIMHLMEQLDAIREELKRANETISSNALEQQRLNALVLSLTNQLHEAQRTITDLARKNEDLQSAVRVSNKHRFGSSSQKRRSKAEETSDRDDNKGDFDGTPDSLGASSNVQAEEDVDVVLPVKSPSRPSRKGCSNKVMSSAIFHTIIETCKQLGMSARDYIKKFLNELSSGRSDWENLTPSKLSLV